MKKYLIIALLALMVCFAFGCDCKSCKEKSDFKEELVFNEYNTVLMVGETKQLVASGDELQWTSSNTEIVSVSETGLITAIKIGNADITVTSGIQSKSITVYVVDAGIAKLETDLSDKYVKVGGSLKLSYAITLNGEKTQDVAIFESLNPAIAAVDANGIITGVSVGETAIKVKYSVSINGEAFEFFEQIKVFVTENGVFSLDMTSVELVVKSLSGDNLVSKQVSVLQKDFDGADNAEIVWTVANPEIATVNNGLIASVSAGETIVTASVKGNDAYRADVNVKVVKEDVFLNKLCFADTTMNVGSAEKTEWAKLSISDANFYGEILGVRKANGDVITHDGDKLKTDQISLGNNDLIIETFDFNYHANVKGGSSFYSFTNYGLTEWEGGKGSYEILGEFNGRTNVLKTYSSKPNDGEVLDEETAEIRYHDVYNNNVGMWDLSAANLFGNSGYIAFDLFVDGPITEVGYYLSYQNEEGLAENIIRFDSALNKFTFAKDGKGRGEVNSNVVKVVDQNYNETSFRRGEWNRVLINCGIVDFVTYDSIKLVISFRNNAYKDGQQTAYYSNFTFIGEEQFFNITGRKTPCSLDVNTYLTFNGIENNYTLSVNNTGISLSRLQSVKYLDAKVNVEGSAVCNIAGLTKGQIIDVVIETDVKIYYAKAIVTVLISNENDNVILDSEW